MKEPSLRFGDDDNEQTGECSKKRGFKCVRTVDILHRVEDYALDMNTRRYALFVVLAITLAIRQETLSQGLLPASQALGAGPEGLRIRISAATSTIPSQGAKFIVALQNTSDADFVLNLGIMISNGKAMLPRAVHLLLTERTTGTAIELQFCGGPQGLSSQLGDYAVMLQAGATYAFPASLDKYCNPATTGLGVKLRPGPYQISARFDGRGALKGDPLLNFWKGTIRSDILEFNVLR